MENLPPAALPPPPPKHISLRKAFPALAEQYHPKRNKRKSIAVPHDSLTPLWWKCPLGPDHEWQATIAQRLAEEKKFEMRGEGGGNADASQGYEAAGPKTVGCPCCSGMKTSVTNSIATKFPAVAAMWSPPSDGLNPERVRPDNLVENSNVNVWFKCGEGPDHVWQLPLQTALKVEGSLECPCCLGKKVSVTNSLKAIRPDIAEMWCTEKNFEIGLTKGPEGVLAESEGFCRVENDEGRVWEVLIRKAVKEEGLPVPPPLPPPPPPPPPPPQLQPDASLMDGVDSEGTTTGQSANNKVVQDGKGGDEANIEQAGSNERWRSKFSKVLSKMKFAAGFRAVMRGFGGRKKMRDDYGDVPK